MSPDWAVLVRTAQPSIVLPPGDRRAQVQVPGPLELEHVLDLGGGHAVGVIRSADGERWCTPLVVRDAQVRRAAPGDGTTELLVRRLAASGDSEGVDGFTLRSFAGLPVSGERGVEVDQTNESVIVGEQVVVKWMTRLPGQGGRGSPAAARIGALARAGFADQPAPWGFLLADEPQGHGQLLACAVAYLPGAEDGWDWATADLRALLRGDLSMDRAVEPAAMIGAITARMHAGLAGTNIRVATEQEAAGWCQAARDEMADALAYATGDEAARLRGWADRIYAGLDELADLAGTPLIAIHGDLHVGQVLRTRDPDRLLVTDFDGNPTLAFADRWDPQPVAVDVAGMLASWDHVGRVVQYRDEGADLSLIRSWIAGAQAAYLEAYQTEASRLSIGALLELRGLWPMRLRQEIREVRYAQQHLPHWVYVPDLALADLLDRTHPA